MPNHPASLVASLRRLIQCTLLMTNMIAALFSKTDDQQEETIMSPLPKRYDPVAIEKEVLQFWEKDCTCQKTVESRLSGPKWSFLEGPPTTNGFMHAGHARGRAMKDAQIRYMTMMGYNVWRRGGWDMQGLPVELEVERSQGIADKGDIEKTLGMDVFVKKCKELVDYYLAGWVRDSVRLGLWLDFETAYQTRRDDYIEHVWHFLKMASEKGLLGRGYRVNPSCPRCVTAVSGHEVSQGYATKVDPSIYVKFPLYGRENEYLVVWTTTPFTLLSNEMVSVHPDFTYVRVKVGIEHWWLVENLVGTVMQKAGVEKFSIVDSCRGEEMLGWKYEHPFKAEVPFHSEHTEGYMHAVVVGEHVTVEDGTGLVHTAPGFGPDDFEVGVKYGVPVFCPVTKTGRFTEEVPLFQGKYVFDVNKDVPKMLRERGLLVHEETIEHEYPHCWRCDTPLIYLADSSQWFLKMIGVRDRLVEKNNQIQWTPEWAGTGRFGDWLANADDWCISRSRIWGTPLPVWVCEKCKHEVVIGSRDELKKRAGRLPKDFELHRPWVDAVVLKCEKCGGRMLREPFVTDCWLDSGMAHTASVDYLRDPSLFKTLFPYDFITEGVDQSRGWFYSLLYTSTVMHDSYPFKTCVSQGHVLDEKGGKMSKSKGNVVWMKDELDKVGADVFRLFMLSRSTPWSSMNYDPKEVEFTRKYLDILWNVFLFAETYMELDKFRFDEKRMRRGLRKADLEDRWLLSRVQTVLGEYHEHMGKYFYHQASRALIDFLSEDLSRVYIPLVKKRVWLDSEDPRKIMAYDVMYYTLQTLTRALSVFTPFLAEKLHRDFFTRFMDGLPGSINMTDMPRVEKKLLDKEMEATFEVLQELRSAASNARNKKGVKLRHPVARIMLVPVSDEVAARARSLAEVLRSDLNTREFEVHMTDVMAGFVRLIVKPNYKVLGPKYKSLMKDIVATLQQGDAAALRRELEKGSARIEVRGENIVLEPGDLEFEETMPDHLGLAHSKIGKVYVDMTRTRELEAEGLIRDVTRRVQVMRKELNLRVEQSIDLVVQFSEAESAELAKSVGGYLAGETRAAKIDILGPDARVKWKEHAFVKEWEIDDLKVKVGMSPISP
ncbi:MAG: isoleucine--tRNA ligase [Candidatus Thorarchaeota archaeon]|nr:isoleucine--tRNA ligase [Candidatus Thorarchaeota archaeon]